MSVDWQANGFEDRTKLPALYGVIDMAIEAGYGADELAAQISAGLTELWDDFWNVFIMKSTRLNVDCVGTVWGFRGQWFWHNNYGAAGRCYLIFKDYNCKTPKTFSGTGAFSDVGNSGILPSDDIGWDLF